jgi:hypothetical protein
MYLDELEYFLKCIRDNKKSFNDINFGENVLRTALLMEKSSIKKRNQVVNRI